MPEEIIGHARIVKFFETAVANEMLTHAYCFVGPEHVGKRTMAEYVSAKLLNIPREKVVTYPDVTIVAQEEHEKTGKTKKNIDIEQLRELQLAFSQRAVYGGYKIAIIDGADKMSLNAANALLKTLEEPKQKSIIFLIVEHEDDIPLTVLSRCQKIYFSPVSTELLRSHATGHGVSTVDVDAMVTLAHGLPGLVHAWTTDREAYGEYRHEQERFLNLVGKPLYEKIHAVEDMFGDKSDAIGARERIESILDLWYILVRDIGRGLLSVPSAWTQDSVLRTESAIQNARHYIDKNIHPRMLVEHILLEIP